MLDADRCIPYSAGSALRTRGDSPAVWKPGYAVDSLEVSAHDDVCSAAGAVSIDCVAHPVTARRACLGWRMGAPPTSRPLVAGGGGRGIILAPIPWPLDSRERCLLWLRFMTCFSYPHLRLGRTGLGTSLLKLRPSTSEVFLPFSCLQFKQSVQV
jgi:hypothetical protein